MKTLSASLLLGLSLAMATSCGARAQPNGDGIVLTGAQALLQNTSLGTSRPGFTGSGYVTGFTQENSTAIWKGVKANAGIYDVKLRYWAPEGGKGFVLNVNGVKYEGFFKASGDGWADHAASRVELQDGDNTVSIEKGWGWYDLDTITFTPSKPAPKLVKPPKSLIDPKATPATRALMSMLVDRYGETTLSGQYGDPDIEYVKQVTGKTPAIYGSDFIDYSPSRIEHGADAKDTVERAIKAAKAGQIVTFSWHWNAPMHLINGTYKDDGGKTVEAKWWSGFYTYATTFDLAYAMDNPKSEEHRLLVRDIDAIAVQLRKLARADVPVLWRPLHEAEGKWFWWGAKGPEPYLKLWKLMYDRLTNYHGLHNLIWVHNCTDPAWYPGDQYVDVEAVDAYPDLSDPMSGTWDSLVARLGGKKLLAIAEFGGAPDVERMRRFGVKWAYFVSWSGFTEKMKKEDLQRIYQGPHVLNAEALQRK